MKSKMIRKNGGNYKIELVEKTNNIPIKNEGYRVYQASWQTHRQGQPIKRKRRWPRWKFIKVFETENEAKEFIKTKMEIE